MIAAFFLLIAQIAVVSSGDVSLLEMSSTIRKFGINSIVSSDVSDPPGEPTTNFEYFTRGLEAGAAQAPIVLSNMGPISEEICTLMASHSQTVFVTVAGNGGRELTFSPSSKCLSKNILFVGRTDPSSNYGEVVRVRIPAVNTTEAASITAGHLALTATDPSLRGKDLVEEFLKTFP